MADAAFQGPGAAALSRTRTPCFWGAVFALWLCSRPYLGIRHDAVLYLGQVLYRLQPSTYAADLFFHYGSQDRYSAFSTLVAPLVQWLGVGVAEMTLLLVAQGALLLGMGRLLTQIGLGRWRWAGLLMLAGSPHFYVNSDLGSIAFAEPFLTARALAEPFAVWALVGLLQRRWWLAGLASVGGMALHPLILLPVLVVGWAWLCLADRRWLWLALLVPAAAAVALVGLPPFDTLARRYDPAWWAIVSARNPLVFPTRWVPGDQLAAAFDFLVLGVAWRLAADAALARFWLASLLAAIGLMALSLLGADLVHDVLITQLQQWRVLWWLHLLVLVLSPWLLALLWRTSVMLKVAALSLAVSLLAIGANWTTGWVFMLAFTLALVGHWRRLAVSAAVLRLVMIGFVLAALTITAVVFSSDLHARGEDTGSLADGSWLRILLCVQGAALLAGGTVLWLLRRLPPSAAAVTAIALLGAAASGWDQRSDWSHYLETAHASSNPFELVMAPGNEVYWMDDLKAAWLGVHAASAMSNEQSAGLLFNRDTAFEYERRAAAYGPLGAQRELCSFVAALGDPGSVPDSKCYPTLPVAKLICELRAGPRYLVFRTPLDVGVVAHWRFESLRPAQSSDYYLHDCNKMTEATP